MVSLFTSSGAYSQKKAADIFDQNNYKELTATEAASLRDSLQLTSEQEELVAKVYSTLLEGLLQLRGDTKEIEARSASIKKLTREQDAALRKILTPEQYKRYEAILIWRASLKHKR